MNSFLSPSYITVPSEEEIGVLVAFLIILTLTKFESLGFDQERRVWFGAPIALKLEGVGT